MSSITGSRTVDTTTVDELCVLDLDRLSDEDIASTLRTVERLRRRLDDLDARVVAQVEQRGLDHAVKLSTPQKYLVELLHLSRAEAVRRVKNSRSSHLVRPPAARPSTRSCRSQPLPLRTVTRPRHTPMPSAK